jgi:hypothetical protein
LKVVETFFFCYFRLPYGIEKKLWFGQMTVHGLQPLDNLTTLKFERCTDVDMSFVRLVLASPSLKNFSTRGSIRQGAYSPGQFPKAFWNQLKVLDISGTSHYPFILFGQIIKYISGWSVTHLYMEKCSLVPHIEYDVKFEFVSVAGLRDNERYRRTAFDSIRRLAAVPSLKEMNVSGCQLSEEERQILVARHPNVIFNMSPRFEESLRIEF